MLDEPEPFYFEPLEVNTDNVINGTNPKAYLRDRDSEFKILNHLMHELYKLSNVIGGASKIKGEVKLFTELPPCPSCEKFIEKFSDTFPNIKIEVIHSNGKVMLP